MIQQGKTFPRLSVLQVHKQLIVLRLSGGRKSTIIVCLSTMFHIIPQFWSPTELLLKPWVRMAVLG